MTHPTHSRERDALDRIVIELRRLEPVERLRVLQRMSRDLDWLKPYAGPPDSIVPRWAAQVIDRLADRSRPL